MYYHIYKESLLQSPVVIGLCAALWLLTLGWTMRALGPDIRREATPRRSFRGRWLWHGWLTLLLSGVYLGLSGYAHPLQPGYGSVHGGVLGFIAGQTPGIDQQRLLLLALGHGVVVVGGNLAAHQAVQAGSGFRQFFDRLSSPKVRRGELGSAHFCTAREYKRYRRPDPEGLALFGAFYGENKQRLDTGTGLFCLNGEDAARGILALGGPGSGKTQGVILPAIADAMAAGHSLILADPQGEIKHHIQKYAAVTGHLVILHDPTGSDGPRFNLAAGIHTVSDARAIANVLVPAAQGDNKFWTDSAGQLLAACLIRYANLGEIYEALKDLKSMAADLGRERDDAGLLANSFLASVSSDGKVASNVVATLATALTGWASQEVRQNTDASDFSAEDVVQQPTVVVLTCPGRMRDVYASYLGGVLRKLMLDLDSIGEANRGPLPVAVNIILDEFPTLGKLDGLVADVNLVRKRRISILIAAQTKGQFHLIYGQDGTQALFTGLATQIVYGGCDAETAEFYSRASGTATLEQAAGVSGGRPSYQQRALVTVDEMVTPQAGNCTIFARYVDPGYATQIIFTARLTRFYERRDWTRQLKAAAVQGREAWLLQRGLSRSQSHLGAPSAAAPPVPPALKKAALHQQFAAAMQATTARNMPEAEGLHWLAPNYPASESPQEQR